MAANGATQTDSEVGLCCAGEKALSAIANGTPLSVRDCDLDDLKLWYEIAVKACRQGAVKEICKEFARRLPWMQVREAKDTNR